MSMISEKWRDKQDQTIQKAGMADYFNQPLWGSGIYYRLGLNIELETYTRYPNHSDTPF